MALPATDNFTGADGTNLTTYSGNWSLNNGNFRLFSNALRPLGTGSIECAARWNADTFADNQYAQATFVAGTAGVYAGIAVRLSISGADTYYAFYSDCTVDSYFIKYVTGAYTEFALGDPVPDGSLVRMEANGTIIRVLIDGVQAYSVMDSSISSGAAGISGFDSGTGTRIDNWEGGNLTASLPPSRGSRLPFALLAR